MKTVDERRTTFSGNGAKYRFQERVDEDGRYRVSLSITDIREDGPCLHSQITLLPDNVRDLLPLLQHFAETGRLPEPEGGKG